MSNPTFYWYDYETFGADTRRDRPAQFAGQRTTLDLEPMDDPLVLYCKPSCDMLPHPEAVLLTGITPQLAEHEGVNEAEFATKIHQEMVEPGTCTAGYNTLRFDDEFTRHLFYRNFFDPYAREWENGNSRWDLIDLARFCYALRPEGIEWPRQNDGTPSFRLEDLSRANSLDHDHCHDALSDVKATIALAQLIRRQQPRLFDFYFGLRRKQRALGLLDYAQMTPVLHISSRFSAQRGCLAMVVPLAVHPVNANEVIVYDLSVDPAPLIELSAKEIAQRVFTAQTELPEDIERVPLKTVHINRSPALAPLTTLKNVDLERISLNTELCFFHLEKIKKIPKCTEKMRSVFSLRDRQPTEDPELALYSGGFLSESDRQRLRQIHQIPIDELGTGKIIFQDARYNELLFRFRARNYAHTLTSAEQIRWEEFCRHKLHTKSPLTTLTLEEFFGEIAQRKSMQELPPDKKILLNELEHWGRLLV